MQIKFTGNHIEVTPALREFTTDKFDRLLRRFDKITSIDITFGVEKLRQIAEATIRLARAELHARSESEDLYSAVDALVDKLSRQLIKHKEKIKDHRVTE